MKPSEDFPWDLAWTRDGNHIVFGRGQKSSSQSKVELWKIGVDGGQPEKLELSMDQLQNFRIHPGGSLCAFDAGGHSNEVWVMENFLPVVRAAK